MTNVFKLLTFSFIGMQGPSENLWTQKSYILGVFFFNHTYQLTRLTPPPPQESLTGFLPANLIIIYLQKWRLTSKRQQIVRQKRLLHHENALLSARALVE